MKHVEFKLRKYAEIKQEINRLENLQESVNSFISDFEEQLEDWEVYGIEEHFLSILNKIGNRMLNRCQSFENTLTELLKESE